MNRLSIMAGITGRREGWKTLDCKTGADYVALVPPLPWQIRDQDWDEIELIHGIGQLYPWDAETLLKEIRAILKPDGVLILEQPNMGFLLVGAVGAPLEWIYGDPSLKDPLHMVKWGYSPQSLSALLSFCGFTRQELKPALHHIPARDFRIEARP